MSSYALSYQLNDFLALVSSLLLCMLLCPLLCHHYPYYMCAHIELGMLWVVLWLLISLVPRLLFSIFICGGRKKGLVDLRRNFGSSLQILGVLIGVDNYKSLFNKVQMIFCHATSIIIFMRGLVVLGQTLTKNTGHNIESLRSQRAL